MDFNSGILPLDFISFYLGMTTEELSAEIPQLENITEGTAQSAQTEMNGLQIDIRPPSNKSNSSCDTEGSLTAYADRTLRTLAAQDPSLDITSFLLLQTILVLKEMITTGRRLLCLTCAEGRNWVAA